MRPFEIDADIRIARGLPPEIYREASAYDAVRERVLRRSWHVVATTERLASPGDVVPAVVLPGCLDEPIVLVRKDDGVVGFSNVCTHRGALLVDQPCAAKQLRCPYHARRFDLDGKCLGMPGFEGVPGFPSADDDLPRVAVATWGPFVFASIDPAMPFEEAARPLERASFVPTDLLRRDPAGDRHFDIDANFLLWCENYLEGFHIPFVHPGLNAAIDWRDYTTEIGGASSYQIADGAPGQPVFDLPAGHPDAHRKVAGLYVAMFATTMLNFYPWGISVNLVQPRGPQRTRIVYQSWVWKEELREKGAGASLDEVEGQDDAIVESVQRGVRSRTYGRPRYSVQWENGLHHFHRQIARLLNEA